MICVNCEHEIVRLGAAYLDQALTAVYFHVPPLPKRCLDAVPAIYGDPTPGIRAWPPKSRSTSGPRHVPDHCTLGIFGQFIKHHEPEAERDSRELNESIAAVLQADGLQRWKHVLLPPSITPEDLRDAEETLRRDEEYVKSILAYYPAGLTAEFMKIAEQAQAIAEAQYEATMWPLRRKPNENQT